MKPRSLVAIATLVLLLAACGSPVTSPTTSGSATTGQVRVVTSFYPLQWAVSSVGAGRVTVSSLTAPGAEPHDLELTPQQVASVSDAQLVVYLKGFQPSVDDAVALDPANSLDATAGVSRLPAPQGVIDEALAAGDPVPANDPHIWLDPVRMQTIVASVTQRLSVVDPDGASTYAANAARTTQELAQLNTAWSTGTKTCARRDLVVSHDAFGYLAQRYGFSQIGISGLTPDAEPSPAKLAEVTDYVRAHHVTTIYYETLVDPKVAQTVATETGATAEVLDPLEGLAAGSTQDYLGVMRANLAAVQKGQACT